ncbi:hypothetical protein TTHERM_000564529 (macronuclear) [Tetrahymena thermophila SB210]|uniref:Uncharacterized protein n=1 Tax=Tetrahymena thermophila (strain SB210) TaxID=312017 RepID=W7XHY5_TETTS|nr:hypothetical protein TTHERM_000564529 [Tetrahymena thermophila SB210]EWS72819.1 hypothetical protein TTHERM_000564529 [Tetrahymena thermophila SB210]|eukprot:XP_012654645.1 hypothetical protein TTHERM_000564529 [Tetrahymena thermophila SB210]
MLYKIKAQVTRNVKYIKYCSIYRFIMNADVAQMKKRIPPLLLVNSKGELLVIFANIFQVIKTNVETQYLNGQRGSQLFDKQHCRNRGNGLNQLIKDPYYILIIIFQVKKISLNLNHSIKYLNHEARNVFKLKILLQQVYQNMFRP